MGSIIELDNYLLNPIFHSFSNSFLSPAGHQTRLWLLGNMVNEEIWTLGDGEGQGGLACCGSCSRKDSETTWTPNPPVNPCGPEPLADNSSETLE